MLITHARGSGLREHIFELVAIRLERSGDGLELRLLRRIRGRAEAHGLEDFLNLAARERIAVGELLSERLRTVAGARQLARPAERSVRALTPAVVPVVVRRDEAGLKVVRVDVVLIL